MISFHHPILEYWQLSIFRYFARHNFLRHSEPGIFAGFYWLWGKSRDGPASHLDAVGLRCRTIACNRLDVKRHEKNRDLRHLEGLRRFSRSFHPLVGSACDVHWRHLSGCWSAFRPDRTRPQANAGIFQRRKCWDYIAGNWDRDGRSGRKSAGCCPAGFFGCSLPCCQSFLLQSAAFPGLQVR